MRISLPIFIYFVFCLPGCSSTPEIDTQANPSRNAATALPNTILMVNCQESTEYGLNNYLLVNHKPVAERYNYLIVYIKHILIKSLLANQQNTDTEKASLSNVFIPVWIPPPNWVTRIKNEDIDNPESVARWIAMNYDYKCARELLKSTHLVDTNYFYIASSLSLLSSANTETLMARRLNDFGAEGNTEIIDGFFKNTLLPRKWTTQNMQNVFDQLDATFNNNTNKDTGTSNTNSSLMDTERESLSTPQDGTADSQKIESQTPPPPARLNASEN